VSAPSAATGRLVLASASPRRAELLARAGLSFEIDPAAVDEALGPGLDPAVAARALAERKARAVAARHAGPVHVIGADTVVALEPARGARSPQALLGKPETPAEAAGMLRALSGTRHAVVTGVCVVRAADHAAFIDSERTWVTMRVIAPREIEDYVASGEWRDKAGGYAIQESADRFVTSLEEGGFDNVVGLPVARTLALLCAAGALPAARLAGDASGG
jgi:septum formation protein